MSTVNVAALDKALKTTYAKKGVAQFYENMAFLHEVPKDETFGGRNHSIQIRHDGGAMPTASFADALADSDSNQYKEFLLTRRKSYIRRSIDGEAIESATGGDTSAFDGLQDLLDAAFESFAADLALKMFGNGGGKRGRVASHTATTITLTEEGDIINFQIGQKLQASLTDGTSGAVKAGTATISKIDRDGLVLTIDAFPGAWADNDYLFTNGDFGAAIVGLDGWLPVTAPTAGDNWYGVDRSVDPVRLAGQRYINTAGDPKEVVLDKALARGFRFAKRFDFCILNPLDMSDITVAMANRIREPRPSADGKQTLGYNKVTLTGAGQGMIDMVADPFCPRGRAYLLTKNTWALKTQGKAPKFLDLDKAGRILRETNADAYETRIGCRGALMCTDPERNMVISWT